MNLLNMYFTPFAALLVLAAIYFSDPDPTTKWLSFGVLALSLAVNHWFTRNIYRFVGWANRLKAVQVWLTFLWAAPLFYLLVGYWAPTWLLFAMPPVTAALYQGRWQTFLTACVSGASMLGLYYLRSASLGLELGETAWAMAFVHAAFIVILSMFVHAMAETALRLRDINARM